MYNLDWYKSRLLAMTLSEVMIRIKREVKKLAWKRKKVLQRTQIALTHEDPWQMLEQPAVEEFKAELKCISAEADRYLEGKYHFLNKCYDEPVVDWNYDNINYIKAPLDFAFDINYKDIKKIGDIKNIWEKNRHQHLTVIAIAYALTKQEQYADHIKQQLISWVEQNPLLQGVNWSSPLEMGIRLISWVWIERLLRGWQGHYQLFGPQGIMWESIYWHQKVISEFYSVGSSANNHLIGEMAGLYIASTVWPYFPESKLWQKKATDILEREIEKQTFASGLNKEQAFSYHIFVLEFFLLAGIEGERFQQPFSARYKSKLCKMIEIIPSLLDAGKNLPRYGDSDEGLAVLLRPYNSSRVDWIFILASMWLNFIHDWADKTTGMLTAKIILPQGETGFSGVSFKSKKNSLAIMDAGLFILAANRDTSGEVFCLFDAGPIGYLSLAAHGHADALSFTLSVGGLPVIIDPGTYQYNADLYWRNYFRGTKAHNTINIDDLDQSVSGGPFLWTKKANVQVLNWTELPNGASITAQHDGYLHLPGRIIHQRTFTLDNNKIEIIDRVLGNGNHKVEWRLHFSPHCKAEIIDNQCLVSWNNGKLIIDLDTRLNWLLEYGGTNAGWYSEGFNLKQPIYTLIGYQNSMLPLEIGCRIKVINSGTSTDNSIGKYD